MSEPQIKVHLEDCQFCGDQVRTKEGHAGILFMMCEGCSAVVSFSSYPKGQAAVNAWNTRLAL